MKLGVYFIDLFANTLLVFMVLTILAFSSFSESPERTLPAVSLAETEDARGGTTALQPVAVSAQRDADGRARYFVNSEEVAWADLAGKLAVLAPVSVVLRIDEELPTKTAIRLMGLLKTLNVSHMTFAFKAP